jgi:protease-4
MPRRLFIAALLFLLGALPACSPTTVSFTFGADPSVLEESTVAADDDNADAKVALIDVTGLIADAPSPGLLAPGPSPLDEAVARLAKAEKDSDVKAVVLRISSPGGTVTGSDTLYREVVRFRERTGKPVVVSMGEIATSGGYYLSLAADRVYAEPTTITGSIGVLILTVNVSGGLDRIGVVSRTVKSGVNKDLANPLEPMRDAQYAVLQGLVDEYYAAFRALVVQRRTRPGLEHPLDTARLDQLADGRILSGAAALAAGLVDATGGVRDAFACAKSLAGTSSARLVKYHAQGATARTPYAPAATPPTTSTPTAIAQSSLLDTYAFTRLTPGMAYFVWMPAGLESP